MAVTASSGMTVKTKTLDPEDCQDSAKGDSLKNAGRFPALLATTKFRSEDNSKGQMFIHLELAETGERGQQAAAACNTFNYNGMPDGDHYASDHDGHTSIEEGAMTDSTSNIKMKRDMRVKPGLELNGTDDDGGRYSDDLTHFSIDGFVQASMVGNDGEWICTEIVRNERKNMSAEEKATLRAKHAEMMRRVRAGWSEEEKAARRAKHTERMRRARAAWSEEEKAARRVEHAERMRRLRAGLSPAESPCVDHNGHSNIEKEATTDSISTKGDIKVEPGFGIRRTDDNGGYYGDNLTALSMDGFVQPSIAGNELLDFGADELRRACHAGQMHLRRAVMNEEQREAIRAHEREAQRKRRAEMSNAKREDIRARERERMRRIRAAWTEEEKAARRAKDAERMRRLRAALLPTESTGCAVTEAGILAASVTQTLDSKPGKEEIPALGAQELRRARHAEQMRLRRARMNEEQREAIRAHEREAQRKRRADMSEAKREAVRARHREATRKRRAKMTDEQREAVKLQTQIRKAQMSEEKRDAVREQRRAQYAQHAKPFTCSHCVAAFPTHSSMCKHEQLHGESVEKSHVCESCGGAFTSALALIMHMKHSHSGNKTCPECHAVFNQFREFRLHVEAHGSKKLHFCDLCDASFQCSRELEGHMRVHTGDKPYSCEFCGLRFARANTWRVHKRTHTGEKPYVCSVCGLAFAQSGNLKGHMRTHTGEKPYICRECGDSFAMPGTLRTHMRVHTGEKPYACHLCDAAFAQNGNLIGHMQSIHADMVGSTSRQVSADVLLQQTNSLAGIDIRPANSAAPTTFSKETSDTQENTEVLSEQSDTSFDL